MVPEANPCCVAAQRQVETLKSSLAAAEAEIARLTRERDLNAEVAARDVSAAEAEVERVTRERDEARTVIVLLKSEAEDLPAASSSAIGDLEAALRMAQENRATCKKDRDALREENGRLRDSKMRAEARHLDAEARAATAREEADARLALLTDLEWSFRQTALRNGGTIYTANLCPICMGEKDPPDDKVSRRQRGDPLPVAGHKPDCRLAALLPTPETT